MNYRHVILEGKPTTGKTEVSNLFKIYFPRQVKILPELTTVLVRENRLNILRDRKQLNDLLCEAVPARSREVGELLVDPDILVFEESHMGVHWAYSKVLGDEYFLDLYGREIKQHILVPDIFMRLDIPVGIAYGSDTDKAQRVLLEVAEKNEHVLKDPAPQAFFFGFGESSLNFELRVYSPDIEHRLRIIHDLHMEIDRAFRAEGIEIAFPQRDLHVRTLPVTADGLPKAPL